MSPPSFPAPTPFQHRTPGGTPKPCTDWYCVAPARALQRRTSSRVSAPSGWRRLLVVQRRENCSAVCVCLGPRARRPGRGKLRRVGAHWWVLVRHKRVRAQLLVAPPRHVTRDGGSVTTPPPATEGCAPVADAATAGGGTRRRQKWCAAARCASRCEARATRPVWRGWRRCGRHHAAMRWRDARWEFDARCAGTCHHATATGLVEWRPGAAGARRPRLDLRRM